MATAQDSTFPNGRQAVQFVASIARTDTSAKLLGINLPIGAIVLGIRLAATANSDAGTTATLSVGTVGAAGTTYLNAVDVKAAATGKGSITPVSSGSAKFGTPLAAAESLNGIYAESGGASTTGGPWVVIVDALVS